MNLNAVPAIPNDQTEGARAWNRLHQLDRAVQHHAFLTVTDARGVIVEVNQKFCELLQYAPEELIGKTHRVLNSGFHSKEFFGGMWNTIKSGSIWSGLLRNRAKDGSLHWLDTTIVPVADENGKPGHFMALRTDVTELAAARDAALAASRVRMNFLSMMSHELRTPLNGILGALDLLQGLVQDPAQRELICIAHQSSNILKGLISNLLDHVRLEADKVSLLEERVELRSLLPQLLEIARTSVSKPDVIFNLEIAEDVPVTVVCDKGKLSQVILNLLGNAAKFTSRGTISLHASAGRALTIEVADTGIGFDEAHLSRLFEPYSQLPGSTRHGGAGLGLSISRQLVNLMGGSISASSPQHAGSRFIVQLPCAAADIASADSGEIQRAGRAGTVLVAEDNELNMRVMAQMLRVLGCSMIVARNGLEALELASGPCDLILMDVQMPEMDGVEAARLIRSKPGRRIPIIAVTADAWEESRQACMDAGMDGFLTKPLALDDLREVLDRYL